MKTILLSLILFSSSVLAQSNVYQLKMNENKNLTVHFLPVKSKDYELQISLPSVDDYTKQIRMVLTGKKKVDEFVQLMNDLKSKYIEWSTTANENNVDDFIKAMPVKNGVYYSNFVFINAYDKNYHSSNYSPVELAFLRRDGKNYLLLRNVLELKNSVGYDISKGFLAAFSDVEEIDNLINILSAENIEKELKNNANRDSLFK